MTKDELLKLFEDLPDNTWMEIAFPELDRGAREFLLLNNPVHEFEQRMKDPGTDSDMLKNGVDYLGRQLTIVIQKRGMDPSKIKGSFKNRVQLAKKLNPPLEPSSLIPSLEELDELYLMSHDSTLLSFAQLEWRNRIEKMGPPIPNLRLRVYFVMFSCAINLDKLGGNTRN